LRLGHLPLALAQAAPVIAAQHIAYGTYLKRLLALPVDEYPGVSPRGNVETDSCAR
jgi:hypothetical protein